MVNKCSVSPPSPLQELDIRQKTEPFTEPLKTSPPVGRQHIINTLRMPVQPALGPKDWLLLSGVGPLPQERAIGGHTWHAGSPEPDYHHVERDWQHGLTHCAGRFKCEEVEALVYITDTCQKGSLFL